MPGLLLAVSNARLLEDVSGTDPWSMGKYSLKQKLVLSEMVEVPEQDTWRIMYLDKLLKEVVMMMCRELVDLLKASAPPSPPPLPSLLCPCCSAMLAAHTRANHLYKVQQGT